MKKLNYLNYLIISLVFTFIKSNIFSNNNITEIINKNENSIKEINDSLSSYRKNNILFNEVKKILKNISYGNELFEEHYNYMNNIKNNITKDESLYHRLIPETLFKYKENISCFNLITKKAMAKDDTGNFVSILLITCHNNSLIILDLLGNIYLKYKTNYIINDIITFKETDINFFYIITNNYSTIKKYILFHNAYLNNNNTNKINLNDTINVKTFTEDEKREKVENFSYELYDVYKQNINMKKLEIYEEENTQFIFNKSNNEYIIDIKPLTIKGSNYIMVITNNYSVYKLDYINLNILYKTKIELNIINNISYNINPISMNFFYVLFKKSEKGYIVSKYENSSIFGNCDLFPENSIEKIKQYYFDDKSKTIYILSTLNKIYLSIPMLFPKSETINKKSCKTIFLSELNKINKKNDNNNFDMILLNKKLMITKDGINYEVIDITKAGEVDEENILQTKLFDLNKYIDNNNFPYIIMKDNKNYLFLKQINDKNLILFVFYEKNAKIYSTEKQNFNFKVPIILVAFIIILIWNYIKSKNEDSENHLNYFKNKFD